MGQGERRAFEGELMQLRILHEPWEFELPYHVQAADMMMPGLDPQPLWYHLRRFAGLVDAKRYMEAYAKGPKIVVEWPISEPVSAEPAPVESAVEPVV